MLEPLEPKEFCQYWIPKLYQLNPGEYGYRKACIQLLSLVTDSSQYTCANWVDYQDRSPLPILKLYLRAIHMLLKIEESLYGVEDKPENAGTILEKIRKNRLNS
jgi:hypothetical protein